MRKVPKRVGIAALAALTVLGLAAQAAVASDPQPDCAGQPQNIRYGWVNTELDTQFAVSEIWAGAVLCGSDTQTERGYLSGRIQTPDTNAAGRGMTFRCANPRFESACTGQTDLLGKQFAGSAELDAMACSDSLLSCTPLDNQRSSIYVDKYPSAFVPENADCAATYEGKPVVACLQGADAMAAVFWFNMLVTKESDGIDGTGVYRLHILQPQSRLPGTRLYYTKLGSRGVYDAVRKEMIQDPTDSQEPIHLCKYAGAVNGTTCGTNTAGWLQKNGPERTYSCAPSPPGGLLAPTPWRIRATRIPGWSPPSANACTPERWTQTAAAGAVKSSRSFRR